MGNMPNGPDDLHRSFVLFFPTEGEAQAYKADLLGRGTDLNVIIGPLWIMMTTVRNQVAAAVDAGGELVNSGPTFDS
jgi:hypothetical protein